MQPMRACYAHSMPKAFSTVTRAVLQRQKPNWGSKTVSFNGQQLLSKGPLNEKFANWRANMSTTAQTRPKFSAGSDESILSRKLQLLLPPAGNDSQENNGLGGRWALIPSGEGLERSFKFKTFAKTWVSDFFQILSWRSVIMNLVSQDPR